ncbi:MAG: nitroreductase family deazaflavin-dependent oxidoreductase [Solirubrobacteraceae bacterium]
MRPRRVSAPPLALCSHAAPAPGPPPESSARFEAALVNRRRPSPMLTRLLRAPGRLYDWHAGWILGRRSLRLTHVGRRTGRRYQTMLEVVGENRDAQEVIVVAGFGRTAQWYRNLLAGKAVQVAIGRERFEPAYRELRPAEAAAVLAAYERRNHYVAFVVRRVLSWLVGWRYDGTHDKRL